nr:immunoglobulin heavy chain junction region [Macaca mulatta]
CARVRYGSTYNGFDSW